MFYYDPVCGKKVNRHKVQAAITHDGQTYYLCCPVCQTLFERSPEDYIRSVPRRQRKSPMRSGGSTNGTSCEVVAH